MSSVEEVDLAEAVFNFCVKARQCTQGLRETVTRMRRWPEPGSFQSLEERHDQVLSVPGKVVGGVSEVKS